MSSGAAQRKPRLRTMLAGHVVGLWLCAVLIWTLAGCDRSTKTDGRDAGALAGHAASLGPLRTPQPAAAPSASYRYPAARRLVAIGDVHGDLAAVRAALRLAGAIDAEDDWIGAGLVVVQIGDQIDRGDDDRAVLDLLDALQHKARAAGGAVHVLNGNHEVLNVLGDFRYVTRAGFEQFSDMAPAAQTTRAVSRYPPDRRGRAAAFLPGGPYARRLAQNNTTAIVGDTLFAHGGILPGHVSRGLAAINGEMRRWMRGEAARPPASALDRDSPVWTRLYSDGQPDERVCATLGEVLSALEVGRMVVGHTVQQEGISSACDEHVWRIDVGMAAAYGGRVQVLDIQEDKVRVISARNGGPD
jgi:hypothetical protein